MVLKIVSSVALSGEPLKGIFKQHDKATSVALSGEQLKGIFKQHDKNGDGRLDRAELKDAFNRLGAIIPGWRAARGLSHADANGDGFITEDEMSNLVKYAIQFGYTVK